MTRLFGLSLSGIILSGLLGMFCGAGAYTFRYGEGLSYLSENPKACVNCHIMRDQYDGWQKAGHHANATCNDCHIPHDFVGKYLAKAQHGFWHSKGFTLQDFHEPIQLSDRDRAMVNHNCTRCHADLVDPLTASAAASGHGSETNCIHCHAHVGHGPAR